MDNTNDDNNNDDYDLIQDSKQENKSPIPKLKISRARNESASSENGLNENGTKNIPDGKRQKQGSPQSPAPSSPLALAMFPNGIPPSPPKFVSLEEIMKAANGVQNMVLAHEIAVDKDFKIEKVEKQKNRYNLEFFRLKKLIISNVILMLS